MKDYATAKQPVINVVKRLEVLIGNIPYTITYTTYYSDQKNIILDSKEFGLVFSKGKIGKDSHRTVFYKLDVDSFKLEALYKITMSNDFKYATQELKKELLTILIAKYRQTEYITDQTERYHQLNMIKQIKEILAKGL